MKVISICNQKGGVGKTTVAYHLGLGLYDFGYSVLLVDFDPQGNLSATFGKQDSCAALEIFADKPSIVSEIVAGDSADTGISLISSNIYLAKAETRISFTSYTKFRKALDKENKKNNQWNFAIIDCPPSLGIFTINALTASDYVLIPSLPYYYSLLGLKDLMEVVESLREEHLNTKLKILGILINQVDRTIVARESMDVLEQKFSKLVFRTKVPKTIRVEEALQAKKPIWEYDTNNLASTAFKAFVEEFLQKTKKGSKQ
jgi:chromosome partitioning protein